MVRYIDWCVSVRAVYFWCFGSGGGLGRGFDASWCVWTPVALADVHH